MHDAPWEHFHDVDDPISGHDDVVVWTTVGIDIGSSTAQIAFSRITLTRHDTHYVISGRETLHESDIILTPYVSSGRIDGAALAAFFGREYRAAGLAREAIDNGAIILTGLALKAENARTIADAVADESGCFVAVSAGDLLEARLAAQGANLPLLSMGTEGVVAHIDVGGGTAKLTAWDHGVLLGVAAIDAGARLIATDADGRVSRIEEPAARIATHLGLNLAPGVPLKDADADRIAAAMARNILRYANVLPEPPRGESVLRTPPLFGQKKPPPIAAVVFSGGVSEYIYGRERRSFGDLGRWLGEKYRLRNAGRPASASFHSTGAYAPPCSACRSIQCSSAGTRCSCRTRPLFHFATYRWPCCAAPIAETRIDAVRLARNIAKALSSYAETGRAPALALCWSGSATHARIVAAAEGIVTAMTSALGEGAPLVVIVDGDVAGVLGSALAERAGERPIVCVDGVHLHEFDHIDIGTFTAAVRALPVVVKSLMFARNREGVHHDHHHA